MSEKALIVRFSAIGDCVMSVPVAASIRRSLPDSQIVWAIEPRCVPVVDAERLGCELTLADRPRWKQKTWSPTVWREQMAFFTQLRSMKFDYGIDLQGHSKTALCLRFAAPKRRISARAHDVFTKQLNPFLTDVKGEHAVDRNLRALSALGEFSREARWVMPSLTAERSRFRRRSARTAVIATATGHPQKNYPLEKWEEVAGGLLKMGVKAVFIGGPGDSAPQGFEDLCGKLSLAESMAAIAESEIVLCADTGAGHIAAAYGVPVVSVFGVTEPSTFAPYTKHRAVLRSESHRTEDVSPGEVLSAAASLLELHGAQISR